MNIVYFPYKLNRLHLSNALGLNLKNKMLDFAGVKPLFSRGLNSKFLTPVIYFELNPQRKRAWLGRGLGVAWAWLGRGLGVAWAWLGRGLGGAWAWLGRGLGVAWAWLGRGLGVAWACLWAWYGRGRGLTRKGVVGA
jgi:hypothetical protein